ncbi:hypothetical protein BDR04DRAFT_1122038 [Suillus decipiens]|nr:hypothetical protein BDR04DRAFT_1122038 [Suillus decipiens]
MDSIFMDSFSSDELSMAEDDDMLQSSSMDSGKQTVVPDESPDESEPVEMKKPKTKRSKETAIIKLYQDEPFDTLKAQILKCISESLKPKKLNYDNYKIMFTILCHQTAPLSLKKTAEYEHLVECAVRMKTPAVKLLIEALKDQTSKKWKNGDAEGDDVKASDSDTSQSSGSDSDSQKGKKKKKKKKLVKELPLNIELSAQIKLLQNCYTCNKPGCLTSGYCYILPDNNAHFTLSHWHLNIHAKLTENGYTGTRTIRYIVMSELKEMGFKNGEIVAMKDAVVQWANREM